jgi:hypothetical protein
MTGEELPGRSEMPRDLYIADQQQFLEQIPDLIEKLRMRYPTNAWRLNLSPSSLAILDDYIAAEVDEIIQQGLDVAEMIDRNLLREVTAYVGEVILRSKNGWWRVDDSEDCLGPSVVFPIKTSGRATEVYYKAIDIYDHILTLFVEGGSLTHWYELETT